MSENFDSIDEIKNASFDDFIKIPEFGEKMAESLVIFFKQDQTEDTINKLKNAGVNLKSKSKEKQVIISSKVLLLF